MAIQSGPTATEHQLLGVTARVPALPGENTMLAGPLTFLNPEMPQAPWLGDELGSLAPLKLLYFLYLSMLSMTPRFVVDFRQLWPHQLLNRARTSVSDSGR